MKWLLSVVAVLAFLSLGDWVEAAPKGASHSGGGSVPGVTLIGKCLRVTEDSAPVCNCTEMPAELQLCSTQTVSGTIGTSAFSVQVSNSGMNCSTQTVQPGMCLYLEYVLRCKKGFVIWSCSHVSTNLKSSTAAC